MDVLSQPGVAVLNVVSCNLKFWVAGKELKLSYHDPETMIQKLFICHISLS